MQTDQSEKEREAAGYVMPPMSTLSVPLSVKRTSAGAEPVASSRLLSLFGQVSGSVGGSGSAVSGVALREKSCLQCLQPLSRAEGCIETPLGAAFHLEHMYCIHCHIPLADRAYCLHADGKIFCERDFIEYQKPECDLCCRPIVYRGVPLVQRILMPSNSTSVDSNSAKVDSSACTGPFPFPEGMSTSSTSSTSSAGSALTGLTGLTVLNYHSRCLKCSNVKCRGMYLPGWQAVKLGSHFFCEQDALEAQQPRCYFCRFAIHQNDRSVPTHSYCLSHLQSYYVYPNNNTTSTYNQNDRCLFDISLYLSDLQSY